MARWKRSSGLSGRRVSNETLNEIARRAAFQMDHTLEIRAVQLQRGVIAGPVIAAVALIAIGWFIADWWRPRADIAAMTCQDGERGGRVCFVWVTPPPAQQQSARR